MAGAPNDVSYKNNTHLSGISIYYFPKDVAVCLRWTRFDGWHWGDFFILNPTTCSFHRISKTGLHLCKYNKIIYVHCAWINEYRSFPGSYEHFLISSGNKAWLKQSPTGFEPMTSVIPVQRSTNWANKLTSFEMRFKPFPELTDILLREHCKTSNGYWHKHKLEKLCILLN